MIKKIILIFFVVLPLAFVIQALPVLLAILYLGGRMIWCVLTGEPFWGEYGPFWLNENSRKIHKMQLSRRRYATYQV